MDKHSPSHLIRLRINPELHQLIRRHAATSGVTQAEIIRRSIRKDLAECAQRGEATWPEYPKKKSIG